MTYKYEKEKNVTATIICYITAILVIVFAIIGTTKSPINKSESAQNLFSLEWWVMMSGCILMSMFVIYCGKIVDTERKNFKKWMSYLINNGVKCNGYVKEIKYIKQNTYELKICYYSKLQEKDINFYAPAIFMPNLDHDKQISCNVYEISEKHKIEDYTSEVINVDENAHRIEFSINPFKLFKVVKKQYDRKWFANTLATDFQYEDVVN